MTRFGRCSFAVIPFLLFGACSELDEQPNGDARDDDGAGGEITAGQGGASGTGAKPGAGGEDEGGAAGTTSGKPGRGGSDADGGVGGEDGGDGGGSSARGGSSGGGGVGAGGSSGAGGSAGSGPAGAAGASGAGGSAPLPPCAQVIDVNAMTLADVIIDRSEDPRFVIFSFVIAPSLGLTTYRDTLEIQFWSGSSFDGALTGNFSLGAGRDSNNLTCSRCLLAYQDDGAQASRVKTFFQTAGTLTIGTSSQQMDGFPTLSYADVTLREVTIDETDGHSTLVPDGACLHFASGSFSRTPEWTCEASWRTDGVCDCGCGTLDPECPDSDASSCDWCWCGNGRCPGFENPNENWTCL